MPIDIRYVPLADAGPDETVVVIDVLRAFTVQPWMFAQGATRLLTVADAEAAMRLRDEHLPAAVLAGEEGGEQLAGFDLGNSPVQVQGTDLGGRTVIHRTSAGTQGLARTAGSGLVLAASFVTAGATARAVVAAGPGRVTFVITGASLGRDGDEDLAAAELIAARLRGADPDAGPYLARIATSDAGRNFVEGGPSWASPADLAACAELDRFDHAMQVTTAGDLDALEVSRREA
jgi:2-phosphosulfolactate phosphatase